MKQHAVFLMLLLFIQFGIKTFCDGQSKNEVLGSPYAIIYDMELIGEKDLVIANLADNIQLWNYTTKEQVNSWNSSQVIAIDYANEKLAGVSKTGSLVVWSIPDGKELIQVKAAEASLISLAWIDAGSLVVGSENGDIIKINCVSGEIVSRMNTGNAVTALALGPDNILIAGSAQGMISVYDVSTMRLESRTKAHNGWIRGIKFSESGMGFITIADDGNYKTWKSGKTVTSTKKKSLGNWLICTDFLSSDLTEFDIVAFGKRNGSVIVDTRVAVYSTRLNSIVNCIGIVRSALPQIQVIVGTHGEGIQVLNAKEMKFSKSK